MLAATAYGAAAAAFSQDLPNTPEMVHKPDLDRRHFETAEKLTADLLAKQPLTPGTCLNVNFPQTNPRGYQDAKTAHYSYHRTPPTNLVPRAQAERSDITLLKEGWVTVSTLLLRTNPPIHY
jgi:broad specificity polyphosphatase/5'/3'-nucleotidase SurE